MANNNKNSSGPQNEDEFINSSRRSLLKGAGLMGAAALGGAGVHSALAADNSGTDRPNQIPVREAFEALTFAQSEALDAVVDRILPADENGPGASEARAVHYIDRSLAGFRSDSKEAYVVGLLAIDEYAQSKHGNIFARLSDEQKDAILHEVEDGKVQGFLGSGTSFFAMVRNHTIEGTFSDPYYGGNRDFIGWDMLAYPGVRMGASSTDVSQGDELSPSRVSAYDLAFTKQRQSRSSNGGQQ
ncbi:MAG: gluconate 2-dehydrogenase subunit 3 family protein [Pseudohongiellaceae bacterium]|nr:gluconate 2-dehydrogenase subunit 3 family protein [Pseudohongiellaceae bacterium]